MLLFPVTYTALTPGAATYTGRLLGWWRGRVERARRAAERRELLALDGQCRRDLGAGRADEEAHKPSWCP